MSIRQSPDERRYALREATYANSGEEQQAVFEGDQREFDRARPVEDLLNGQATALADEVDAEVSGATDQYAEVRDWANRIRNGEVDASPDTAAQLQGYRAALGLSIAGLEAYVGRLEHSAAKCGDPWQAYCDLVSKFPQVNRG